MAYELSELLTPERIAEISTGHGFRPDITEQFLMDYLVHQLVTEGLECMTKGGICMPFYQRPYLQWIVSGQAIRVFLVSRIF